ncbi:MAG: molybdenum cofactor biosynthesis protein MoaE [Thermoanaerobaculia bacterium]
MKISIVAFASARDAIGAARTEVELAEAATVETLAEELGRRYPDLRPLWPRLALAVDGILARPGTALHDGSEVALLPPVSGGSGAPVSPVPVSLVNGEPDPAPLLAAVDDPAHGATLLFLGRVRGDRDGRAVTHLTYEAYEPMALAALRRIVEEIEAARGCRLAIAHRIGEAPAGRTTVAIAASAPHREAAYAASREALERLKREVPIWKREHYADGAADWLEVEPLSRSRG